MKFQIKLAKTITAVALTATVLLTGWQESLNVHAASNAVPSYEVKFLLDSSKVLKSDGTLQSSVTSAFDIEDPAAKQLVEYFDTNGLDLNDSGWTSDSARKKIRRNTK